MKYLAFEVSTEYESLVAVVEWDANLAQVILARFAILQRMVEGDSTIKSISYDGDISLHEYAEDFEMFEEREGRGPHLLDEPPPLGEEIRLSTVGLEITKYGNFYWTMLPKHGSDSYEAYGASVRDEELFSPQKERQA